jgi:hypothetical protein
VCVRCGAEENRGSTREDLFQGLRAIGVSAVLAPRGRPEEGSGQNSIGLIDIYQSSIHWVNVRKWYNEGTYFATDYGVQDSRTLPRIKMRSVRVRSFPILGTVIDVRWQGDDKGTGAAVRLAADLSLKAAIMFGAAEITVRTSPEFGCWLIPHPTKDAPPPELWRCYELAARRLPETPPTGVKR